ncbi:DUF3231 family protein [Marinicrinis lubricantis]|uniref:DUF3231 family protein n=1 Tax=Marinicrinis lubricantis TaxID=2086470 RepID=A0ABW1ILX3_9BACL
MSQQSAPSANIRFCSTDIGGLWSIYQQESINICFLTFFVHHVKDEEITMIAKESLKQTESRLLRMKQFFEEERYPIPDAFSVNSDVQLDAPPLFHDPFVLSYVYMMNRLSMINYGFIAANVSRLDVFEFFKECIQTSSDMYGKALKLMMEKGVYDRPPKMNYPAHNEYVQKNNFLDGIFGENRRLNAVELTEIFFNIERNYFSIIIMLGFAQVIKDKKLRDFIIRGKNISEKQIEVFNKLLMEEDLLGMVTVSMEVTDSTTSPFSEKLVMMLIHTLNSVDITLISHALSLSMRTDLFAHYTKFAAEVMQYAKDTFDIVVERQWLEQPPLVTDRRQLIYSNQ